MKSVAVMLMIGVVACGKQESGPAAKAQSSSAAKPEERARETATKPATELRLDSIGVTAVVSAAAYAEPFGDAIRIMGPDANVDVSLADDAFPKTAEALQQSQQSNGTEFQTTSLPDGWALRYKSGSSYILTTSRDVGGKRIRCGSNASNPERIEAAFAVCKSLKP